MFLRNIENNIGNCDIFLLDLILKSTLRRTFQRDEFVPTDETKLNSFQYFQYYFKRSFE